MDHLDIGTLCSQPLYLISLSPTFRFIGSDQWSVACWLECPTSSSLLAVHHARSWWRVWPVRISRSWRRPAWPDHRCPRSHRTPWEPSRPTNKKTTEGTGMKNVSSNITVIFIKIRIVLQSHRSGLAAAETQEKLCIKFNFAHAWAPIYINNSVKYKITQRLLNDPREKKYLCPNFKMLSFEAPHEEFQSPCCCSCSPPPKNLDLIKNKYVPAHSFQLTLTGFIEKGWLFTKMSQRPWEMYSDIIKSQPVTGRKQSPCFMVWM